MGIAVNMFEEVGMWLVGGGQIVTMLGYYWG